MTISRRCLHGTERIDRPAQFFDYHFSLRLEPFVFDMARSLSQDYGGGYWEMYQLGNGGFYMAPASDSLFHVSCVNGYEGNLSADALGITVCLYAYSNLSFSGMPDFAEKCTEHYHLLREYMFEHAEVKGILGAID
jgi:hypothetical protein